MANQLTMPIKLPTLLRELHGVEWMSLGRQLGVPDHRIQTIQQQFFASSPQQRLFKVLEWWMDNALENEVTWICIAVALREIHYYKHSEVIVLRYCSGIELDGMDKLSIDGTTEMTGKFVNVNQEIAKSLLHLKFQYGKLTAKLEQLIYSHLTRNPFCRNKHLSKFVRVVSTVLEKEILEHSFTHAYNELAKQNDMFELAAFRDFVFFYFENHPAQSRTGMTCITIYEQNMKQFIQSVTVGQFRDAVCHALPAAPGYDHLTLILNEDNWSPLTLLALKKLLYKVFGVNQKVLLDFIARKGSIIVQYRFREDLREVIIDLGMKNQEILKENNVIKLMIGSIVVYQKDECKYPSLSVQDALRHPVQTDSNVPGSFSVKPSQESPLVSQQRTAPRPPTQARGMATSLTKIQIPSIHVSSSESRSNTPPMSLASSPTSIYARDFFSQQIDLPVPRPRSYTAPNKILLHPASQRNSPSISRTSELGGHNHQTDLCDDSDNDKDFLRPGRRISSNSSIDSGLEPTNEYAGEFLKERRKCSLRADEDYFVPYAAMTELKETLLSKQSMFFEEMQMMMLAQRELIFELKEEIHSLKDNLQCLKFDRGSCPHCKT